jgi:hypothetical protein
VQYRSDAVLQYPRQIDGTFGLAARAGHPPMNRLSRAQVWMNIAHFGSDLGKYYAQSVDGDVE